MGSTAQPSSKTFTISQIAELGPDAMQLLKPELHPLDFVGLLMESKLYTDAVRFLAHALPKREAVWWGWMSARKAAGENPPPPIKNALLATEKWIADPNEDNRRAAMAAGEAAQFSTGAGCAALGAFFSGGSLAPPDAPTVPPGEYLTAKAICGAVNFAAMSGEPAQAPEKFKTFISQGVEVTNRIKLWQPQQG